MTSYELRISDWSSDVCSSDLYLPHGALGHWNVFQLVLNVVFMLITLFFVYKDGDRMIAQLDVLGERILPLRWQSFSRVVPANVGRSEERRVGKECVMTCSSRGAPYN